MDWSRYSLSNFRRAIKNPRLLLREPSVIYYHESMRVNRPFYRFISSGGEDFVSQDWDNLIILDACRFDWFKRLNRIEGELSSKVSKASESWEFMQENFVGKQLYDTVYVTSNPHSPKIPDDTFHAVYNLLETHWSEDLKTVPPQEMVKETVRIQNMYPNKRIISHFMQPHFPFIGDSRDKIKNRGIKQSAEREHPNPWLQLNFFGGQSTELILQGYHENHEIAIRNAAILVNQLSGKTVIASDHANLLGEWVGPIPKRMFGHPRNFRKKELVTVPWLEIKTDNRRTISTEPPIESQNIDADVVESRLHDLGYV